MSEKRNLSEWLGLSAIEYPIPAHANTFWYSLGGITLTCFVVTLVTGAVIAMPTKLPGIANSVMRELTTDPGCVFLKKPNGRVRIW